MAESSGMISRLLREKKEFQLKNKNLNKQLKKLKNVETENKELIKENKRLLKKIKDLEKLAKTHKIDSPFIEKPKKELVKKPKEDSIKKPKKELIKKPKKDINKYDVYRNRFRDRIKTKYTRESIKSYNIAKSPEELSEKVAYLEKHMYQLVKYIKNANFITRMNLDKELQLHDQRVKEEEVKNNELIARLIAENEKLEMKKIEKASKAVEVMECAVCMDDIELKDIFFLESCSHSFCKDCVRYHIKTKIGQRITKIDCPSSDCSDLLDHFQIRYLLNNNELFKKFEEFLLTDKLDEMDDVSICPNKKCSKYCEKQEDEDKQVCPTCGFKFCFKCKKEYHPNLTCLEYKAWKSDNGDEVALQKWVVEHNAKKCPSCGYLVEKVDGCNKMICGKCHSYFCWLCEIKIDGYGHFDRGECKNGAGYYGNDRDDSNDYDSGYDSGY